ncbi:unnamed protein product, partial [Acanthoscelides obtectus]
MQCSTKSLFVAYLVVSTFLPCQQPRQQHAQLRQLQQRSHQLMTTKLNPVAKT